MQGFPLRPTQNTSSFRGFPNPQVCSGFYVYPQNFTKQPIGLASATAWVRQSGQRPLGRGRRGAGRRAGRRGGRRRGLPPDQGGGQGGAPGTRFARERLWHRLVPTIGGPFWSFFASKREGNSWFTWWLHHLPGPSIFQKAHLCSQPGQRRSLQISLCFEDCVLCGPGLEIGVIFRAFRLASLKPSGRDVLLGTVRWYVQPILSWSPTKCHRHIARTCFTVCDL